MRLFDDFLFQPKNTNQKRTLTGQSSASGLGKLAFVDEYCRRSTNNCITITYNTEQFESHFSECITVAVDLAARLLMPYFLSH